MASEKATGTFSGGQIFGHIFFQSPAEALQRPRRATAHRQDKGGMVAPVAPMRHKGPELISELISGPISHG